MKIDHKGYEISFFEHCDEWRCRDLNVGNVKLSVVKKKVDAILLKERKKSSVPCFVKTGYHKADISNGTIIGITSDFKKGDGRSCSRSKNDSPIKVSYTVMEAGSNRAKRKTASITELFPRTQEVKDAVERAKVLDIAASEASKAADKAWRDIPRMGEGDVVDLLALFRSSNEGENQ